MNKYLYKFSPIRLQRTKNEIRTRLEFRKLRGVGCKNEFFLINESNLLIVENSSFASLHSNRDIEVCQIYLDSKGRKTTALVSKNNTIYIPAENSININKIKVNYLIYFLN